ncbi:unnamed protein product [Lactuca saligna]|uniref:Uncharacterized protein n=1 Tax=Lactuca saligna TaxID=75948 RepID=A0AA35YF25_LACSI|nr:unnamed protein product [Lactuca saligna]
MQSARNQDDNVMVSNMSTVLSSYAHNVAKSRFLGLISARSECVTVLPWVFDPVRGVNAVLLYAVSPDTRASQVMLKVKGYQFMTEVDPVGSLAPRVTVTSSQP